MSKHVWLSCTRNTNTCVQDEPLDSEAPRRAFDEMAAEVNRLAAIAGSSTPSAIKTADDVRVTQPLSLFFLPSPIYHVSHSINRYNPLANNIEGVTIEAGTEDGC